VNAMGGLAQVMLRELGEEGRAIIERLVATDAVGPDWVEEPRPVPGKPELPPDSGIFLDSSSTVGRVR